MMREYVALLRECLSGERVTFEGDYYQVKRFSLGIRQGERRPRIIMAALNPKMLALAGEIADGVLLNYLPVSHVGPSVEAVDLVGPRPFTLMFTPVRDRSMLAESPLNAIYSTMRWQMGMRRCFLERDLPMR